MFHWIWYSVSGVGRFNNYQLWKIRNFLFMNSIQCIFVTRTPCLMNNNNNNNLTPYSLPENNPWKIYHISNWPPTSQTNNQMSIICLAIHYLYNVVICNISVFIILFQPNIYLKQIIYHLFVILYIQHLKII